VRVRAHVVKDCAVGSTGPKGPRRQAVVEAPRQAGAMPMPVRRPSVPPSEVQSKEDQGQQQVCSRNTPWDDAKVKAVELEIRGCLKKQRAEGPHCHRTTYVYESEREESALQVDKDVPAL